MNATPHVIRDKPVELEVIPKEIAKQLSPEVLEAVKTMERNSRAKRTLSKPAKLPIVRYYRLP